MQPKCSQHAHPYKAVATFHLTKDDTSLGVGSPKVSSEYIPQFYKARRLG
jgi:hypothetical protein